MAEEYDVIVIGAGPGGYVAAIRAAQLGLKTLLVEKNNNLGGTCLNVGCIPSKTLLYYSEQLYDDVAKRSQSGLEFSDLKINFPKLMETKSGVIKGLNMGINSLLKKNKVTHKVGVAKFKSAHELQIGGQETVLGKHIIIATGSESRGLESLPFDEKTVISSTGALSLPSVPKNLLVIGAGVIGLELGSVYQRLGSKVHFIEAMDSIGGGLDASLSKPFQKALEKQGLTFDLKHKFTRASKKGEQHEIVAENEKGEEKTYIADVVLISIGRIPYTKDLNLESVGIEKTERGFIKINHSFETTQSHVYAIGDVVEGPMLAHKASEEGVAIVEKIAQKRSKVNYLAVPNVIYTSPELATVGFSQKEAQEHGLEIKVGSFPFLANSRAHCVGAKEGLVQVIADAKSDRVLGLQILSEHAGEMIAIGSLAIEMGTTAKQLGALCFAHPTLSEAIKEAALAVHKEAIHF